MKRRQMVGWCLAGAAGRPLRARAQGSLAVRRIGVLMGYAVTDAEARMRVSAFMDALNKLGWTEGRNARFEYRWASGDTALMASHAAELVALRPDVILASTTPVVRALLKETRTIPIVFLSVSDPVGDRLVQSLAHPGGNATGFINIESSMAGKWVELAREVAPSITTVAIVFNPQTAAGAGTYFLAPFETAARSLGLSPMTAPVQQPADFEAVIPSLARKGALIVMPDSFNVVHRKLIISVARDHRVPVVYPYRYMAADGGLLSYGVDLADMYRRAASHMDQILRGRLPRDLPIEAPAKFELVINTRAARQLGLQPSAQLLARADEILE